MTPANSRLNYIILIIVIIIILESLRIEILVEQSKVARRASSRSLKHFFFLLSLQRWTRFLVFSLLWSIWWDRPGRPLPRALKEHSMGHIAHQKIHKKDHTNPKQWDRVDLVLTTAKFLASSTWVGAHAAANSSISVGSGCLGGTDGFATHPKSP